MPEFTGVVTQPGLYPGIPEDEYHRDPVPEAEGGSLSVSGAKKLLPPSCPAIFEYERRHPKPATKDMQLGTVVHGMLLGTGQPVRVLDYPDYRKKEAQDAKKAAIAAGAVPMLPHEHAEARAIAQAVRDHDVAGGLLAEGDAEQSMFWRDAETGIWLRGRTDWLTWFDGQPTIVDVKTAADSSPEKFAKSADEYGYYMQDPWYREGVATLIGCDWQDVDFVFLVVPTTPPYLVMHYRLDATDAPDPWLDVNLGRQRNRIAREKYRDCTEAGIWPAWSSDIHPLSLPAYARRRIESEILHGYDY